MRNGYGATLVSDAFLVTCGPLRIPVGFWIGFLEESRAWNLPRLAYPPTRVGVVPRVADSLYRRDPTHRREPFPSFATKAHRTAVSPHRHRSATRQPVPSQRAGSRAPRRRTSAGRLSCRWYKGDSFADQAAVLLGGQLLARPLASAAGVRSRRAKARQRARHSPPLRSEGWPLFQSRPASPCSRAAHLRSLQRDHVARGAIAARR